MSPDIGTRARLTLCKPLKNDFVVLPIAVGEDHAPRPVVRPEAQRVAAEKGEIMCLLEELALVLGIPWHRLGPAQETRRELRARSVIDLAEFRRAPV